MRVFGFTSNFFFISSGFPAKVTNPAVLYLTTFGFVEIAKLKLSVTWLFSLFCSSSFALTSKKSSSFVVYSPVRSACKLLRLIETITPETEYCGFTADSSPTHLVILIYNCYMKKLCSICSLCLLICESRNRKLCCKIETLFTFCVPSRFENDLLGAIVFNVD